MNNKCFWKLAFISCLILLTCGCHKSDISGIYKGKIDVTDKDLAFGKVETGTADLEMMLAQTGKNISGKVTFAGQSRAITSGIIVEDKISIEADSLKIDAFVKGNSISGSLSQRYGGIVQSVHEINGTFNVNK